MLGRVCEDLKRWRAQGLAPPRISLNASIRQLQRRGFAHRFLDQIQQAGVSRAELEIEITEKVIQAPDREIEDTLRLLTDAGIDLVVDDFGTSHSSLRQLHHFGFRRIKLHGSLSAESLDSREHAQLTAAVIAMARSLGVSVAADGVETEEQATLLSSYACEELQGSLISRELTSDEFAQYLRESKPDN
jgi:EAL domain-containing protein (putative c-di-GMP-specific phosphodiesterase class I)